VNLRKKDSEHRNGALYCVSLEIQRFKPELLKKPLERAWGSACRPQIEVITSTLRKITRFLVRSEKETILRWTPDVSEGDNGKRWVLGLMESENPGQESDGVCGFHSIVLPLAIFSRREGIQEYTPLLSKGRVDMSVSNSRDHRQRQIFDCRWDEVKDHDKIPRPK